MTSPYVPEQFFVLDPHADEDSTSPIPIDALATRVYGKEFSSLQAASRDDDGLSNDSVVEYDLTGDDEYQDYLEAFDDTRISLGYHEATRTHAVKRGMTQMEYWQSITWIEDRTVETTSPETVATWRSLWDQGERAYFEDNPWVADQWAKLNAGELTIVQVNPKPGTDLEGVVFEDAFFANRAFSPSLGAVLADLIRRGELPRGKFLFQHWW